MSAQLKRTRSKANSQAEANQSQSLAQSQAATLPSTSSPASNQPLTKKQQAKERGQRLYKSLQEKKARGEIKRSTKKRQTKSQKAGIFFNVDKVLRKLKQANPGMIVRKEAAVLTTGVIEYLVAELLELSGNAAAQLKSHRIKPRHVFLAVANDPELETLLQHVTIKEAGVMPNIHPNLLKSKVGVIPRKRKASHHEHEEEASHQEEVGTQGLNESSASGKRVRIQ